MLPVFRVLYFGFMGKQDQELYNEILQDLYRDHGVSEKAQRRVEFIHQDLCKKGMYVYVYIVTDCSMVKKELKSYY